MTRTEIVAEIARERRVEKIVSKVFKASLPLSGDAADLSQMIYLSLLEKPAGRVEEIRAQGIEAVDRFLAGMVMRSILGKRSDYNRQIRGFAANSRPLKERDTNTDIDAWEKLR